MHLIAAASITTGTLLLLLAVGRPCGLKYNFIVYSFVSARPPLVVTYKQVPDQSTSHLDTGTVPALRYA